MLDQNVRRIWSDHDLHLSIAVGNPRHTGRYAGEGRRRPLSAGQLVDNIRLEDRLVLGKKRRLLSSSPGLVGIEPHRATDYAPLALEIWILTQIEYLSRGRRDMHH